eukprot:g65050.t1
MPELAEVQLVQPLPESRGFQQCTEALAHKNDWQELTPSDAVSNQAPRINRQPRKRAIRVGEAFARASSRPDWSFCIALCVMRLALLTIWSGLTTGSFHAAEVEVEAMSPSRFQHESWGGSSISYDELREREDRHHARRLAQFPRYENGAYGAYGANAYGQNNNAYGAYGYGMGNQQAPAYTQNAGANYGAYGQAGSGAYGMNAGGGAYGVYNQGGGGGAYGAYGQAGPQNAYGAYGNTGSQNAYGAYGNSGQNAYGAYGNSGSQNAYGAYGNAGSHNGNGAYGNANQTAYGAYGAYGQSQAYAGYGQSQNAYGAYGQAQNGYGGNGGYGAYGAHGAYGSKTCSPSPSHTPSRSRSPSPNPKPPGALFVFGGITNFVFLETNQEVGREKDVTGRRRNLMDNDNDTLTWVILNTPAFPQPRYNLASAVLNNLAYAIGGNTALGEFAASARVDRFDPAIVNWTRVNDMNVRRSGLGAAAVAGRVYAIGGATLPENGEAENGEAKEVVATTECFNPSPAPNGNWSVVANMTTRRAFLGVVALDGKVYAFGGLSGPGLGFENALSSAEVYSPVNNKWTTIASMREARSFHAAAVLNGSIYAIGGQDNQGQRLKSVECYDPNTNNWTKVGSLNVERADMQASVIDGVMYVVGGITDNGITNSTELYDPLTQNWTISSDMNQLRVAFGLASLLGKITP